MGQPTSIFRKFSKMFRKSKNVFLRVREGSEGSKKALATLFHKKSKVGFRLKIMGQYSQTRKSSFRRSWFRVVKWSVFDVSTVIRELFESSLRLSICSLQLDLSEILWRVRNRDFRGFEILATLGRTWVNPHQFFENFQKCFGSPKTCF